MKAIPYIFCGALGFFSAALCAWIIDETDRDLRAVDVIAHDIALRDTRYETIIPGARVTVVETAACLCGVIAY